MIKSLLIGLWACAVTAGAVFYSFQNSGAGADKGPPSPYFGGLDYVKTEIISVPLVRNSKVEGYLLTQLVYTVDPAKLKALTIPAGALIGDEVYTFLYKNPQIDFAKHETVDLDGFRQGIKDAVNARLKDTLIQEVLVDQLDFLSKDEIRDNAIRRRIEAGGATAEAMSKGFKEPEAPSSH